ncbi:DUF2628 domain-containing protein [Fictibacillus halophilus]|uniref:DUF2628 domain-containing protein n=1 Tax=Fictibacillus halophilus TaxID=1610490 RepID=UPI001CFA812F|nr:DUF2628 domain-containing protein [Fictibacillus halophilus]
MNEALKEPVIFEEEHKVVQKNTEYYDMKWGYVEDPARNNTWNWAAFFLFTFWLAYRKMYKPFFIISIFQLVWMIPFFLVDISQWFHVLFYLSIALLTGRQGNRWYYNYVSNVLKQTQSLSPSKQNSYLKSKGGINVGMMIGLNMLLGVTFFISIILLASMPTETNIKDVVRWSDEATKLETSTDEPAWTYVKKEGRYHIVEFTGFDFSKEEELRMVFHVYHDKDMFEWKEVHINGKKLNEKDAAEYQLEIRNKPLF